MATALRRRHMSPEEKLAYGAFHEEARAQRCCQNPDCQRPTRLPWDPHHVIYEQELARRGLPLFDPRNVLRLCRDCHMNHHAGIAPIPLTALTQANLAYAFDVLGEFARDYLYRRYLVSCPI
jgi:hypothetical protein